MKRKPSKRRLREIEKIYRTLGLGAKEARKYFPPFRSIPEPPKKVEEQIFIEVGTTSVSSAEFSGA